MVRDAVSAAVREAEAEPVACDRSGLAPEPGDAVCDLGLAPREWSSRPGPAEVERVRDLVRRVPAGVRVVRVSVLGADAASRVPLKAAQGTAEEALRSGGADVVVMRVGIVLGPCGLTGALHRFVQRSPLVLAAGIQRSRFEPLALADLASYLVLAATTTEPLDDVYDLGCGEMLTGGLFLTALADNLGLSRWKVPVPLAPGAAVTARFGDEEFPAPAVQLWLGALASGLLPRRMNAWERFPLRPIPMDVALANAVGMEIPLRRRQDDDGGRFGWKPPRKKGVLGLGSRRIKR